MDLLHALHTMARRHCIERHAYRAAAYEQLEASGSARKPGSRAHWEYTDQAYATFPRYLVWEAILKQIERLEPRLVRGVDQLREELVSAGSRAQTTSTANPHLPPAASAAMSEEREEFARFIRSVGRSQLAVVESLPMRRVFGEEELKGLWQSLHTAWDISGEHYWWPLRKGTAPREVLMFHTDWFDSGKHMALREILARQGVERVWEVREFREWGCEQSLDAFEPAYSGEEGYWTSSTMDWLVYASHESSITLAGEWLVGDFRQRFPDCGRFDYGGPMSTPDQRGAWKM